MFALLNTKTEYSFLDSVVRVDDYLNLAQRYGYQTVGICDNGNLHAAYRFITKAKAYNLQAVVSIELAFEIFGFPMTLSFIAKSTKGYKNLLRISTLHNQGQIQFADIQSHLEDLAVVIPEAYGDLSALVQLKSQVDLYVGINQKTQPGVHFGIPMLPFPAVRYLTPTDNSTLEVLHTVRDGGSFDHSLALPTVELMQRPEAYEAYYQKNFPGALKNLSALTEKNQLRPRGKLRLTSI